MTDRRLFPFRIAVWIVWLLTAWGILQYAMHAWKLGHLIGHAAPDQATRMSWMLAWDAVYVLVSGLTLSAATGVLMWRGWARPLLRWLAFGLAVYTLASGVMMFAHWQSARHALADQLAVAQTQHPDAALALQGLIAKWNRTTIITLVLKVLALPVLGWLGWFLGTPGIKQRFDAGNA